MKKIIGMVVMLAAGGASGAGAAYAAVTFLGLPAGPSAAAHGKEETQEETALVATGPILAPLVSGDGRLAGYVSFEAELEVAADAKEDAEARLPLLLNAVNMRTHRTPMASGPDGQLPDVEAFRALLTEAGKEAFGKEVVKRAMVTKAQPA